MASETEGAAGMVHKKSKAINSIPSYANSHKEGCPQSEIQISKIKILIIRMPVVQLTTHAYLQHPISGAGRKTIGFKSHRTWLAVRIMFIFGQDATCDTQVFVSIFKMSSVD